MGDSKDEREYVHFFKGGVRGSRPVLRGAEAKQTFDSIPAIDMTNIWSEKFEERKAVADKIGDACRNVGFFYAENHPIPQSLIDETFDVAKKFFALPVEDKMDAHLHKNKAARGYEPMFETKMEGRGKGDLKEGFLMAEDPYDPLQNCPFTPPPDAPYNQWPSAYPEFRIQLSKYLTQMKHFTRKLASVFALALDLPEDFFAEYTQFPMTGVRCLHFPAQEKQDGKDIGLGAHSDVSFFTLVHQYHVAALQVLNANGIWIDAPPRPNSFVVNVGDYLEFLTNEKFTSTVHRVINRSGQERFSLPFFFSADRSAELAVLPTCREEGKKYETIPAGEFFTQVFKISRWQHPDNAGKPAAKIQTEANTVEVGA